MTWVRTSKILVSCFLFVIFFHGYLSRPQPSLKCTSLDCKVNISCTVINLEYVDCNWTAPPMQEKNYTFHSLFKGQSSYHKCPEYLQEHKYNLGCRIPFERQDQRFDWFSTKLYMGGNRHINKNYTRLLERVKLNPPCNVSAEWNSKDELCVYWVNNVHKLNCVVNMVRYRRASDPWQIHNTGRSSLYCMSYASKVAVYTFQVRSNIDEACGPSKLWSDWSDPVQWGNHTAVEWQSVLAYVLGAILLIALAVLLCYCERIKVVFLPAVPDPSKNLQNLFQKYNGNVESWVHVSEELKEAFEPDYTDVACVVCDPNAPPGWDVPTEQPSS
ncbi:interleukin 2 receptor, gamma b isoform X2 [Brachyhypopomus gauderio]|uniref:interleukin 2 receptor, gamma b isoform X2 n=1 Tax=Brachyhypopomus gauderio TaxID=698409 RepID=UPI0040413739